MENLDTEKNLVERKTKIYDFLDTKKAVYLNMLDYAGKLLGIYLGAGFAKTNFAEGIMNEIFGDLMDGTRSWDMDKINIEQVLWKNIPSEVSNFAKKEQRFVPADTSVNEQNEDSNSYMDSLINTPPKDIEGTIDAVTIENYCVNNILTDDEDAKIVFDEMMLGKTQKQIAEYLGLTIREAENIIRRIRRKLSSNIPYHLLENLPVDLIDKIINYNK